MKHQPMISEDPCIQQPQAAFQVYKLIYFHIKKGYIL